MDGKRVSKKLVLLGCLDDDELKYKENKQTDLWAKWLKFVGQILLPEVVSNVDVLSI